MAEARSEFKVSNADILAFRQAACSPKTLFLTTCGFTSSGCHSWGKNLAAQFPSSKSIRVNITGCGFCPTDAEFVDKPSVNSDCENIILSGCSTRDSTILSGLKTNYGYSRIKNVFFVFNPWLGKEFYSGYIGRRNCFKGSYTFIYLDASIGSNGMGIPLPAPSIPSLYQIENSCFGLIYNGNVNFMRNASEAYLKTCFEQVYRAGKQDTISILAIGVEDSYSKERAKRLTKMLSEKHSNEEKRNIEIEIHFISRLAPQEFMKVVSSLAAKNGYVFFDGAVSLMQAMYVGARYIFYPGEVNKYFSKDLVALFNEDKDLQPLARVILGLDTSYHLLSDQRCDQVYKKLNWHIKNEVRQFEEKVLPRNVVTGGTALVFSALAINLDRPAVSVAAAADMPATPVIAAAANAAVPSVDVVSTDVTAGPAAISAALQKIKLDQLTLDNPDNTFSSKDFLWIRAGR